MRRHSGPNVETGAPDVDELLPGETRSLSTDDYGERLRPRFTPELRERLRAEAAAAPPPTAAEQARTRQEIERRAEHLRPRFAATAPPQILCGPAPAHHPQHRRAQGRGGRRRPGCSPRRRVVSRSAGSGSSGDPDEGEPAEGRHQHLALAEAAREIAARALRIAEQALQPPPPAPAEQLATLWQRPEPQQAAFWRALRQEIEAREAPERRRVVAL
jgi:hypothetical protein